MLVGGTSLFAPLFRDRPWLRGRIVSRPPETREDPGGVLKMRTVVLTAGDPTAHSHSQMATTHSSVSLTPADGTEPIVVLCAEDRLAAAVVRFWADEGEEQGSTPRE